MAKRTFLSRGYIYLFYFAVVGVLVTLETNMKIIISFSKISNNCGAFDCNTNIFMSDNSTRAPKNLKYILQWTSPTHTPFVYMGIGRNGFIYRNCSFTNCYVTSDRNYLLNYKQFDVIAFAGPEVNSYEKHQLPTSRSPHQKYVYAAIESARYYPICRKVFDEYFNWTWTYKLDSDLRWGYLVIKDKNGRVVGPNKVMNWIKQEDMLPVSKALRNVLKGKTKLAAWFVSNCVTVSNREDYVRKLNLILETKYNLSVDIYGACGSLNCSRTNETKCLEMIRKDYYFYLSFENAFSEDYVTEKLLNAVQNNVIPIVYGGSNYSRFLPKPSYLNARKMTPRQLAKTMIKLMNNFEKYTEYFKWTNHYSYHRQDEGKETNEYCKMCELLNNDEKVRTVSVYKDLRKWWDPPDAQCEILNRIQIYLAGFNLQHFNFLYTSLLTI